MKKHRKCIALVFAAFVISTGLRIGIYKGILSKEVQNRLFLPPPTPSPKVLRFLSLGDDGAVAMSTWLHLLPYLGELFLEKKEALIDWNFFASSLSTVIALDELFYDAYLVSANLLAQNIRYLDLSLKLTAKGVEVLRKRWDLAFFQAFNYYYYKRDEDMALKYYRIASQRPRCPSYVRDWAAALLIKKGKYEEAVKILEKAIDEASVHGPFKEMFKVQIKNLKNLILMEKALDAYKKRYGHLPESLSELVEKGFLAAIPKHPTRGQYRLDPQTGRILY